MFSIDFHSFSTSWRTFDATFSYCSVSNIAPYSNTFSNFHFENQFSSIFPNFQSNFSQISSKIPGKPRACEGDLRKELQESHLVRRVDWRRRRHLLLYNVFSETGDVPRGNRRGDGGDESKDSRTSCQEIVDVTTGFWQHCFPILFQFFQFFFNSEK